MYGIRLTIVGAGGRYTRKGTGGWGGGGGGGGGQATLTELDKLARVNSGG